MDITILNKEFEVYAIVDVYNSFIWTDRYDSAGDFEFYASYEESLLSIFQNGYYLTIPTSDRVMIIESIETETDVDDGVHLKIKGYSLEYILRRRVALQVYNLDGNFQTELKKIIDDNIISPSNADRKIPNFIFKESTDEAITSLTITAQYTGKNIYEIITSQCKEKKIGFKITLDENLNFVFEFYAGIDRSYQQNEREYVLFSPELNNLANSRFIESTLEYYTVASVKGESDGQGGYWVTDFGSGSGLERRELFVNAGDLTRKTTKNGATYEFPESEYLKLLRNRGKEQLAKKNQKDAIEAEADATIGYEYMKDFYVGDICQLENEFGKELRSRITEMIFTHDDEGVKMYPTFTTVQEDYKEN